jgi:hypothetical protein
MTAASALADPAAGFALVLHFELDPAAVGTLLTLSAADGTTPLTIAIDAGGSLVSELPGEPPQRPVPGRINRLEIAANGAQLRLSLGDATKTGPMTFPHGALVLQLGSAPPGQAFHGWIYDLELYDAASQRVGRWSFHQRHGGPGERFPPRAMPDFGSGDTASRPPEVLRDLTISPGRYYVEGIACELAAAERFSAQADLPGAVFDPGPDGSSQILYLEVSERIVTAIQDPNLREVALGGADITVLTRTVAQVRSLPIDVADAVPEGTAEDRHAAVATIAWRRFLHDSAQHGRLRARRQAEGSAAPLENLLYRVEIHAPSGGQPAKSSPGGQPATSDPNGQPARSSPGGQPATFKWSRMNGSVAYPLRDLIKPNVLRLGAARPDRVALRPGDWVELLDDTAVVLASVDQLRQIQFFDSDAGTVTLTEPLASASLGNHPFLCRWDHRATVTPLIDGAVPVPDQGWIELEHGIEVAFEAGPYRTGDHWCLPARSALRTIIWPGGPAAPAAMPPEGISRRFARLATFRHAGDRYVLHDDRRLFLPLADNDFLRHGGTIHGNVSVQGWLRARVLEAERLSGMLETPGSVPLALAKLRRALQPVPRRLSRAVGQGLTRLQHVILRLPDRLRAARPDYPLRLDRDAFGWRGVRHRPVTRGVLRNHPVRPHVGGLLPHDVGLTLQPRIVVDPGACHPHRRPYPPLALLHQMPRLMRQVMSLARTEVDFVAGGIGERVDPRRFGGAAMHGDAGQVDTGQRLDRRPETVRYSARPSVAFGRGLALRRCGGRSSNWDSTDVMTIPSMVVRHGRDHRGFWPARGNRVVRHECGSRRRPPPPRRH